MNEPFPHLYPVDPVPEPFTMRSFDDPEGGHWQAALMEASFGNVLLIFSRIGSEGVLHKALDSANYHEAEMFLAGADEAGLQALLAEAEPWN